MKLAQLLELHKQENPQLSPRTVDKYSAVIKNFINDTGEDRIFIDRQTCIYWHNKIYQRVKPITCNNYHRHMQVLFNTAVKLGHLRENIFKSIPMLKNIKTKPKTLDKDAIIELIIMIKADCYYSKLDWFYLAMIDLFIYTAIRRRQLIGITWGDIDFQKQTLLLASEFSKNRIENLVPLNDLLINHLKIIKQKTHKHKANDQVFNITKFVDTYKGNSMTEDHVSRLFTKWSKKINIKISAHRFRHTTATKIANSGCNLKSLQQLLGHQDIKTTLEYVDVNIDNLRDIQSIL